MSLLKKKPSWPDQRDLYRYIELIEFNIPGYLSEGGLWIDIGAGTEARAMLPLADQEIGLVAVGIHPMKLHPKIQPMYNPVPSDLALLREYQGQARLVTDVYGAVSYCENPLLALVYEALLLNEFGELRVVTELYRFGSPGAWPRFCSFLAESLGMKFTFQEVTIFADANKKEEQALQIFAKDKAEGSNTKGLFQKLSNSLKKPDLVRTLWQSDDRLASIFEVCYSRLLLQNGGKSVKQ